MSPKPAWYASPIQLPERSEGRISVRHRIVTGSTPIVSKRQAILRGIGRTVYAKLAEPLRVHELFDEDNGVWMTDLPEELNQCMEALEATKPRGRVLVGGLGLGIMAALASVWPGVREVVVVERSPEIIKLCRAPGYQVIESDILTYLAECDQFDCWMLDTWQGTNETTWWSEVLPLRRMIANRFGRQRVHCWAEDIMLGQVIGAVQIQGGLHWHYKALRKGMTARAAKSFVRNVGLPVWERKYGKAIDALNLNHYRESAITDATGRTEIEHARALLSLARDMQEVNP